MRTTILIDEKLLRKAMKATGLKTRQAVVEAGLRALIQSSGRIGDYQDVSDARSTEDLQDVLRASFAAGDDLTSRQVER